MASIDKFLIEETIWVEVKALPGAQFEIKRFSNPEHMEVMEPIVETLEAVQERTEAEAKAAGWPSLDAAMEAGLAELKRLQGIAEQGKQRNLTPEAIDKMVRKARDESSFAPLKISTATQIRTIQANRVRRRAWIQHCLVGWKNFESRGELVEFSPEVALSLLGNEGTEILVDQLIGKSQDIDNFRLEKVDSDLGKLGPS